MGRFDPGRHQTFQSFEDLLDVAKRLVSDNGCDGIWSRKPTPSGQTAKEWSGTESFEEAIGMAGGSGYPEGWEKIKKLSIDHGLDLGRMKTDFDIVHDLSGEMVDVGRFLECDPECMITLPDCMKQGRGRTIEILFNMTTCCNACGNLTCFVANPGGDAVTLRGMAVMALLNKLWDDGFSVELFGIFGSNKNSVVFPIVRAGEGLLDPHRVAYILMHPSAFRRIGLSVLENCFAAHHESEYGEASKFEKHESDIYIPAQSLNFANYEESSKWVSDKLADLRKKLMNEGREYQDQETTNERAGNND